VTGGFELVDTENSGHLWVVFRGKEKATSQEVIGRLVVKPGNTAVISRLSFQAVDPAEAAAISRETRGARLS
jgi:hypothetical protein